MIVDHDDLPLDLDPTDFMPDDSRTGPTKDQVGSLGAWILANVLVLAAIYALLQYC